MINSMNDKEISYYTFDNGVVDKTTVVSYGGSTNYNIKLPSTVKTIGLKAFTSASDSEWKSVTIEGTKTRFNSSWTNIGWPSSLMPN